MAAKFIPIGEPAHDAERQALRFLVEGLPSGYTVYGNAWLVERSGVIFELDAVVVAPHAVYVVEIKSYRGRIEGTARLKVKIRGESASSLNLRLAESLAVRGVFSPGHGRLLHLRIVNQNSLIVSLPSTMVRGSELWLSVSYVGFLESQELDREAIVDDRPAVATARGDIGERAARVEHGERGARR